MVSWERRQGWKEEQFCGQQSALSERRNLWTWSLLSPQHAYSSPSYLQDPLLLVWCLSPWGMTLLGEGKESPKQIEFREEPGSWEPIQGEKLPPRGRTKNWGVGFPETACCLGNWETLGSQAGRVG